MTTKPTPVPNHKLGKAMQHMVEMGKRPCFRIEGIRITMASAASTNPGYLYIKGNDWSYIGKITPMGLMKIQFPSEITDIQKTYVLAAINDPEGMAMSNGKITGTCCCCGRTLTNALSIELGIGPICRGFWFPPGNVDTVAMLETLDAVRELDTITDSLDLDLGMPEVPKVDPVTEISILYRALNDNQRMTCLDMLEEVESNGHN